MSDFLAAGVFVTLTDLRELAPADFERVWSAIHLVVRARIARDPAALDALWEFFKGLVRPEPSAPPPVEQTPTPTAAPSPRPQKASPPPESKHRHPRATKPLYIWQIAEAILIETPGHSMAVKELARRVQVRTGRKLSNAWSQVYVATQRVPSVFVHPASGRVALRSTESQADQSLRQESIAALRGLGHTSAEASQLVERAITPDTRDVQAVLREVFRVVKADAEPAAEPASCAHSHWVIASPNGPTSEGHCRDCGETRSFPNSLPDIAFNRRGRHSIAGAA